MLDSNFIFSQSSLNTFKQCPLKFKKKYIDHIIWKNVRLDSKQYDYIQKGLNFHIIAQRHFMGIDNNLSFNEECAQLNEWIINLKNNIEITNDTIYRPEFELRFNKDNIRLRAKYDLIAITKSKTIHIFDWKTMNKKLDKHYFESSIQTKVYMCLMVKAGERLIGEKVNPDNVCMTYWTPYYPNYPAVIHYNYDKYCNDKNEINKLIESINQFDYGNYKPQHSKKCQKCEFQFMCMNIKTDTSNFNLVNEEEIEDFNIDDVEEISFL